MFTVNRSQASQQDSNVKRNLHDKLKVSDAEIHSTRECVNLVTHTNFTALSRLLISKFNARGSGYELERRFSKFVEITQSKGHNAIQGQSRSPISTNRKLIYDFLLVINT